MARAHGGRARTVVTLILLVLMASASSACDANRICTAAGCPREIGFAVEGLTIEPGEIYIVDVCLDHECHGGEIEAKERWPGPGEDRNDGLSEPYVPITATGGVWVHPGRGSFTLYLEPEFHAGAFFREHVPNASLDVFIAKPDGTVITDVKGLPVNLHMWEANGPGCGVCIAPSPEMAAGDLVLPHA